MKILRSFALCAAGMILGCGAAWAQQAGAAAPEQGAAPASGAPTVKTVGDWMVRCFPINSPSPCDMFQELEDKRTHQKVLSLSIAYVPSLQRYGLQISVPLEVSIPRGLVIQTDSFTSPAMPYRRCDRMGCYVETAVDNGTIESLSKSGPNAKIRIYADSGKAYELRFSLNGFAAAQDQMMADSKAKAKAPAKAEAAAAPPPKQ